MRFLILISISVMPLWSCVPLDDIDLAGQARRASLDPEESLALARRAKQVLETKCSSCHGSGSPGFAGLQDITNYQYLLDQSQVKPFELSSKICARMKDMPPASPSALDQLTICRWIQAGAPSWEKVIGDKDGGADRESDRPSHGEKITEFQIVRAIEEDILSEPIGDRQYLRYLTMHQMVNLGLVANEQETFAFGLSKLLNSVSWNPEISIPRVIDRSKGIYRFDLRDYNLTSEDWESFQERNPYMFHERSEELESKLNSIASLTNSSKPYARADWFVKDVSRPPLYHRFAKIPSSLQELESMIGVNLRENIKENAVSRLGFLVSGVSFSNRILERHSIESGYFWISYDFADNQNTSDIFSFPIGPYPENGILETFKAFGGEVIIALPNGLQAYMLVDENGLRIEKAPTNVVQDPLRPDLAVQNGISCISCHVGGMNKGVDAVRSFVEINHLSFQLEVRQKVAAMHPKQEVIDELYQRDQNSFLASLGALGISANSPEPTILFVLEYEANVNLEKALIELATTEEKLSRANAESPIEVVTKLIERNEVSRSAFEASIPEIIELLSLQRIPKSNE